MTAKRSGGLLPLTLLIVPLALGGCGDHNQGQTMGQRVDSAIDRTTEAARDVKRGGQEAAQDARTATMGAASQAREEVREEAREAASGAGPRAGDTKITAQVNAGLAADKDLSTGAIDVTTREGVVTLKGMAPNATAKARAGEIARNVKDVKSVDNQLTLRGG